jgi:hypothetical protein
MNCLLIFFIYADITRKFYAFTMTKNKDNRILSNTFSDKILKSGGFDERFNQTSDNNSEMLITFQKNMVKMNLLKKLQSMDISEAEKLKEVEKYQSDNYESKYLYNLEAGGLYNDWNFNID